MTRIEQIKARTDKGLPTWIGDTDWLLERNAELLEALKAMVEIARADGWQKAFTGRQIVFQESEQIIAKAEGQ